MIIYTVADPPSFLHTEQSDDQVPTLLDEKSQLDQLKRKESSIEHADDPPSEIEVREKDAQLHDSKRTALIGGIDQLATCVLCCFIIVP